MAVRRAHAEAATPEGTYADDFLRTAAAILDAAEGLLRSGALREPWTDQQAQRSGLNRVGSSATEAMRWARR